MAEQSQKIISYQIELSSNLLQDIINNHCILPTYTESKELHLKFISSLIGHINSFSKRKYDYCPIT